MSSAVFRPIFRFRPFPAKLSTNSLILRVAYSRTAKTMAQEFKVKDLSSLDLKDGEMKQVELEGLEGGKILLANADGNIHATSPNCTHFGAPLVKGVMGPGARITCPWHGGRSCPFSMLLATALLATI